MQQFVHLHLHSEYSLVNGITRIKPLIAKVAETGMPAVALTDQGNLFAMVKFYRAAMGAGVKPIIGADIAVVEDPEGEKQVSRLLLLCQNRAGYMNLTRLLSNSYIRGQIRDVPHVHRSWLDDHAEGLIVLSGGRHGNVGQALLKGDKASAKARADSWLQLFGDRFYLEVTRTGRYGEEDYLHGVVELATELGVPVVATNDVHFLRADDFPAHEARVCINEGTLLTDPARNQDFSEQQYLRTPEEMIELFSDLPEALENTVEIAKRCNLELSLGKPVLPAFPIPEGETEDSYFSRLSHEGLQERLTQLRALYGDDEIDEKVYLERLDIELNVIIQMGFPGYFLIVADFFQWAKNNVVPVGPGRGSGAGSLVAYALKITDLDPLRYDLLFERFLNPERVSMPDFDVDFCMEGRDRVIDYVVQHYGRDRVSQIITYGSMAAKAVVRDVGRVLGHGYGFVDKIAKLIPFEIGMTLDKALEQEEALRERYEKEEEVKHLIDLGRALEGVARNAGKHAGGVVISPSELNDFTPLYCEPGGGGAVTQLDKDDVEAVGLVKFDFLGLRTLTIIDWSLKTINAQVHVNGQEEIDIAAIPLDDKAAFDLLKACGTTAVFQLESRGMKDLIKRLQPDCFEDIVALVALFRPGPLQSGMVDDFIERKHGRTPVVYPHPALEPILQPTYGVILYQEQVMQIAQELAGYSLGGADLLRRAMGKKKPEEMEKQRTIFLEGSVGRGVDKDLANSIFDLMEKFAGYGFNKSHSAAYALVSYQTAWLKAHYPAAFMAAVLSSDMDNTDKVVTLIEECRQMKLNVLPPDVNRCYSQFTVNDQDEIIYGLGAIKGVGTQAIDHISEERENGGVYKNLLDFCRRVDTRKVNRRTLESLVKAGAMDNLKQDRASLLASLDLALASADQLGRAEAEGQTDLFGTSTTVVDDRDWQRTVEPWSDRDRLAAEKETLGLFLSGHPIDSIEPELNKMVTNRVKDLQPSRDQKVVLAGLVVAVRTMNSRRGDRMAIVTLDDRTGRIEFAVFSELYQKEKEKLIVDSILVVEGAVSVDDYSGGFRMNVDKIHNLDEARNRFGRHLIISLNRKQTADDFFGNLADVLKRYNGEHALCPVRVYYRGQRARAALALGEAWKIQPCENLLKDLQGLAGKENVKLEY